MQPLSGLRALRPRFEGFLVDLWGVVHDGERLFDGVTEALAALADGGARLCFVSNSSKRGEVLAQHLVEMGISREHFVDVVSSGDVTRRALLDRDPAVFAALPEAPRVLHLGHPTFVPWLFDLPFRFVEALEDAELVVSTGTVPDRAALDALQSRLSPLAERSVPMVCTNPDRLVGGPAGVHLAPGAVAHAYAERGGSVFFYGKPHAPIYRAALARLGVESSRVVGLGDMLDTDVRGARDAGLTAVLVAGSGVHADDLRGDDAHAKLCALCTKHEATPDFVLEHFRW